MPRRLLLLIAAVAGGTAVAADWPQWRGPNRDGKSADTGLLKEWPTAGPPLLWKLADVGAGYGTPAVVGDRLYLIGSDGKKAGAKEFVLCLAVADGKELWRAPIDTTESKFLDAWGGGPRSTPTVRGDLLYALGASGDLVCLKLDGGSPVWSKNLVTEFGGKVPTWGYAESPLVDGGRVVVCPGNKAGMVALDGRSGDTLWQCKELTDAASYSSAVVSEAGGVRQYVQQSMASGFGVAADTGKLLWRVTGMKRAVAVIPSPVVKDDYVFFTSGYNTGAQCIKLAADGPGRVKATPVYEHNPVMSNHHGGVIAVGDVVYGHTERDMKGNTERGKGTWIAYDFLKGPDDALWRSDKLEKGSITLADGYFYCLGENNGDLVRIKVSPAGWEEAGRFQLPAASKLRTGTQGKVWPHPVVANGRLYLRDYELVFCYDLRQPGA